MFTLFLIHNRLYSFATNYSQSVFMLMWWGQHDTGQANDMDNIIASVKDLEVTPERIRKFLPKVNWDLIASMYVGGRTGAECESRYIICNS